MSTPVRWRAWPRVYDGSQLTPLLTPESGRHSPAELALFPPGWVRSGESLAAAKRATRGHRAWPCCSVVKLFARTKITECDIWFERLRSTLRHSRSIPAIAMPPQTSSMPTSGAFGGGNRDLSLAIRWAGRAWRLTGFPLNVKGKGRPSRDLRARVDTTCDRNVALWFATHNCGAEPDG